MDATKIQLSPTEMQLITNAEVILTKNIILNKVWSLLQSVQEGMIAEIKSNNAFYGNEAFKTSPKISKGENYEGLPYLILDYPRVFDKENIFAARSMFWWGNFFSSTLHLGGKYKLMFKNNIINNYSLLADKNFFIGINKDPWIHHFGTDNYLPVKDISVKIFEEVYDGLPQIKIAAKWPLTLWTSAANNFIENWLFLLSLTKN